MKYIYWFIIAALLVVLFLSYCNKPKPNTEIITVSGKDIHDTIIVIDNYAKKIRDSFLIVLNKKYKQDDYNYQQYLKLLNENSDLQNQISVLSKPIPDTCKKYTSAWSSMYDGLKNSSSKTITGLQETISTQSAFIKQKDIDYNRMKSIADTCSKYLSVKDKIKPKRELNIGLEVGSTWTEIKPIFGIGIGYRDRKGNQANISVYSNQSVSFGIKKPLIKF